ncbi:DUF4401 domain-containing protein [uncultured Halopseudomonas sp.]|mgnify:CR=1 FL=1|uniref:DUF4401 domain-containing protein n=1 Tax=uncultured Halopseudomonas sp. TaxID=2901193 RepID=UPI0030EB2281|tara:strand:- start:13725 stop:14786 length:1062 start_codon:yes stop_codon:yes gene_type:complete
MTSDWLNELLTQMQAQLNLDASQREALLAGSQSPWWLSALLGMAAWVSSLLFILSFLGPWLALIEDPFGRAVAGVLLILAALWMFRREHLFTNQVGLALSLTGQGLLVFVLADQLGGGRDSLRPVAVTIMLLSGILFWLPSSFIHRHVCALLMLSSAAVALGAGVGLAFYCVLLAAAACTLWLERLRWVCHPHASRIRALVDAATFLSLVLAAMPHQQLFSHLFDIPPHAAGHWVNAVYPAGMSAILLGVVAWLGRHRTGAGYWSVLAFTILITVLTYSTPGFLLSLAFGLVLFQARNRSWLLLLPAFVTFYLFVLYYNLTISLLEKSLLVIACGAVLLAGARLLPLLQGRPR